MNLLQTLSNLYDKQSAIVGQMETVTRGAFESQTCLAPFLHNVQNRHLVIQITELGDVHSITLQREMTLIPTTFKSRSRSSGVTPHPVIDKLKYCANDMAKFPSTAAHAATFHTPYMQLLTDYKGRHIFYDAILAFLKKYDVLTLLAKEGILLMKGQDIALDKKGIKDLPDHTAFQYVDNVLDLLVDFEVVDQSTGTYYTIQTTPQLHIIHREVQIQDIQSNLSTGICYITGKEAYLTSKHPKFIRSSSDATKLISSITDTTFYTYQGRFQQKEELYAFACDVEVSFKAHAMLRYLIDKQAVNLKGRVYLLFHMQSSEIIPLPDELAMYLPEDDSEELYDSKVHIAYNLQQRIRGFFSSFQKEAGEFCYLVLDSTDGKGRLSVIDYTIFTAQEYEQLLLNWSMASAYHLEAHKVKRPSFYTILSCCYYNPNVKPSEKLLKKMYHQLQTAIIRGQRIPRFITDLLFQKTLKSFMAYKNKTADLIWVLQSVQAYNTSLKGGEKMEKNRSYYFGELLAIAEQIEKSQQTEQTRRSTNAERYANMLAQRPKQAWGDLYRKLQPYLQKSKYREFYQRDIDQVLIFLSELNGYTNERLDEDYLIGYSTRRHAISEAIQATKQKKEAKANAKQES